MTVNKKNSSYSLTLANGIGWEFSARGGALSFLKKMGSIIEFTPGNCATYPKIVFTKTANLTNVLRELFPNKKYKKMHRGPVTIWRHDKTDDVICELRNVRSRVLKIIGIQSVLSILYEKTVETGGLPAHAALLEKDGKGILIAARGNTGKTTCCKRVPSPWKPLCDDEALIVRCSKGKYAVHPFPTWSGYLLGNSRKTWDVQRSVPLAGIFFLEQSRKDSINPMTREQAIARLIDNTSPVCERDWKNIDNSEKNRLRIKLFNTICTIAATVPCYILQASLKGKFWEQIESAMEQWK